LDKLLHLMGLQVGIGRRQRAAQPAMAGVGYGASRAVAATLDPDLITGTARRAHYELPMLSWVNLPAGSLTMHTIVGAFEVPAFAISRYPVTHAQFRAFVDDMGYSDQRWWEGLVFPTEVELPDHTRQTHPMVNVTWYEAIAFCRWLSHKTGLDLTLPTEAQWQWAAHGEARTLYPWGDTFDLSRCNIKESGFGGTTPVDRFAEGLSPFGVADLSGNVWEWTRSEYDSPDKEAELKITSPTLRGGSFEERMKHVRTTSRARYYPHLRRHDLGFRIASRTWVELKGTEQP
jgi:formylglycine-generating enzyme required for sulfatase activity